MAVGELVCRLALAGVFAVAGLAKLADPSGTRRAATAFGLPAPLARPAAALLPAAELAAAVALVAAASVRLGALGAAVLLTAFIIAIANAVAHGRSPDCHCFGQVHSAPAGWGTLARNVALLGAAVFVAVAGRGPSATDWITRLSVPLLAACAAGLAIACLAFALASRRGRPVRDAAEPSDLSAARDGLAVGVRAPDFELRAADGYRYSLCALLAPGRRVLLVFTRVGCDSCDALLREIPRWQDEHRPELEIAVVASGDPASNEAKAAEYGIERMLLQERHEVATAYQVPGTPMAVTVGSDGSIETPTVRGPEAIAALVADVVRLRAVEAAE